MRVFSTFTGIGGFELGIANAGIDCEVVGYSEIDKYAIKVYERQFEGVKNYGDITKINADELPDFDCIVGGFPCQAFSIAGNRKGFDDTRGTLFFDLARILRAKQPRLFVFENVKGLLNHDNGKTFRTIISAIDELGYDCQWQVLNSKDFGVAQNRERVIIVGHLRGTARPEVFSIARDDNQDTRSAINIKVVGNLNDPKWSRFNESSRRVYDPEGISPTVPTGAGGGQMPKIRVREATMKGYAEATVGDSINLSVPNSKTRRGRVGKGIANTLDTAMRQYTLHPLHSKTIRVGGRNSPHGSKQNWDSYKIDGIIRRLTPLECERLQGFPDNWTIEGAELCTGKLCNAGKVDGCLGHFVPISNAQRYKMCGNAVTTNVIQAVFEKIKEEDYA